MEKQRGMAFGFQKTATAVKKPDRQIDKRKNKIIFIPSTPRNIGGKSIRSCVFYPIFKVQN